MLKGLQLSCGGRRLQQYNEDDFLFKFKLLTSYCRIAILQAI